MLETDPFLEERLRHNYYLSLANGSKEDYEFIKEILQKDPRKNLRNAGDPDLIANRVNKSGQTPLYIACQNGNLDVQFCIKSRL